MIAYFVNASWIAFLGFAHTETTATFTVGAILGAVMLAWSTRGMLVQLRTGSDKRFISWLPGYTGAGLAAVSGLVVMILSLRGAFGD